MNKKSQWKFKPKTTEICAINWLLNKNLPDKLKMADVVPIFKKIIPMTSLIKEQQVFHFPSWKTLVKVYQSLQKNDLVTVKCILCDNLYFLFYDFRWNMEFDLLY